MNPSLLSHWLCAWFYHWTHKTINIYTKEKYMVFFVRLKWSVKKSKSNPNEWVGMRNQELVIYCGKVERVKNHIKLIDKRPKANIFNESLCRNSRIMVKKDVGAPSDISAVCRVWTMRLMLNRDYGAHSIPNNDRSINWERAIVFLERISYLFDKKKTGATHRQCGATTSTKN